MLKFIDNNMNKIMYGITIVSVIGFILLCKKLSEYDC